MNGRVLRSNSWTTRCPKPRALALDSSLAHNLLGWVPAWDTHRVARETAA